MTLCVAWIREIFGQEELIIATDSALTGGEKWNNGVKLFELPRKDCLICFAGSTGRAYPLILNLISSIKLDKRLHNSHTDIVEVLVYISELFTSLVQTIQKEVPADDIHLLRSEAKFIFGGWSWEENRFRLWKLYYSADAEGFIYLELTADQTKTRMYSFLGDPSEGEDDDIETPARERLRGLIFEEDKQDDKLDMEPLKVLIDICRDHDERYVDGSIQIAKVYKSGVSEFFGIYWPSIDGHPHFQGREFAAHERPDVKYFDPDTLEIIEDKLPLFIRDMSSFETHKDFGFIRDCYDDGGGLRLDLSETIREKLMIILRDTAYVNFISTIETMEEGLHERDN